MANQSHCCSQIRVQLHLLNLKENLLDAASHIYYRLFPDLWNQRAAAFSTTSVNLEMYLLFSWLLTVDPFLTYASTIATREQSVDIWPLETPLWCVRPFVWRSGPCQSIATKLQLDQVSVTCDLAVAPCLSSKAMLRCLVPSSALGQRAAFSTTSYVRSHENPLVGRYDELYTFLKRASKPVYWCFLAGSASLRSTSDYATNAKRITSKAKNT